MSWRLRIRPRTRLEIIAATQWYAEQESQLAVDFRKALSDTLRCLAENPFQYQLVHAELRRARLRRFPYLVVYSIAEEEVIVLGCVHGHIDPRRWMRRT